jgi:hypothetical protein
MDGRPARSSAEPVWGRAIPSNGRQVAIGQGRRSSRSLAKERSGPGGKRTPPGLRLLEKSMPMLGTWSTVSIARHARGRRMPVLRREREALRSVVPPFFYRLDLEMWIRWTSQYCNQTPDDDRIWMEVAPRLLDRSISSAGDRSEQRREPRKIQGRNSAPWGTITDPI